jgi:hypothetical protein
MTDPIGDRWLRSADGHSGSITDLRLQLRADETLHGVAVTVTTTGPVSVDGSQPEAVGSLTRGIQVVTVPVTVTGQGIGNLHASVEGIDATGQQVTSEDDLAFAGDGDTVAL